MPGPDEIRRAQQERPLSPALRDLLAGIPKVEFDPTAMRRRLADRMRVLQEQPARFVNETLGVPPGPNGESQ